MKYQWETKTCPRERAWREKSARIGKMTLFNQQSRTNRRLRDLLEGIGLHNCGTWLGNLKSIGQAVRRADWKLSSIDGHCCLQVVFFLYQRRLATD